LGELKHSHFGKPIHLDESLFSNEEDDSENEHSPNEGEASEVGICDFLSDLSVGKSQVSKLVLTNTTLDTEPVSKWRDLRPEEGPEPPRYIPSPPKIRENFLETILKVSHKKILPTGQYPTGRSLSEKSRRLEKKPKAKFGRSPNGPSIEKVRSSSPPDDNHLLSLHSNPDISLSSKPKPLPRPPSLLLNRKTSAPKFQLLEKAVTGSDSGDTPPLSPTPLSLSPAAKGLLDLGSSGENNPNGAENHIHMAVSEGGKEAAVMKMIGSPVKGTIHDAKEVDGEGLDISVNGSVLDKAEDQGLDLLEFLSEIKNSSSLLKVERKETVSFMREKRYEDLPLSVKQRCRELKLEQDVLAKHMDLFWRIAYFLYREEFPPAPVPPVNAPVIKEFYASELVMEHGKSEIKYPPKSLKKLFRGGNLTGEGGYGKVFVSRDTHRKDSVAIKKVSHSSAKNKETNYSEVGFLSSSTHPNIVSFYHAYLNVNTKKGVEEVWIITEFLYGGTLAEAAKNYEFKEKHVRYIAREILQALAYIHSKGWAHRDLKSPNIMITLDGQIKLIDFGLCADMNSGDRIKLLGSAFWIPPEMINRQPHTLSVDIWSFGVCLLELFIRGPPFAHSALFCMFTVALVGLQSLIPSHLSDSCKDFLSSCLKMNPSGRPAAQHLLEHDWLKQPSISRADLALTTRSIFMVHAIDSLLV